MPTEVQISAQDTDKLCASKQHFSEIKGLEILRCKNSYSPLLYLASDILCIRKALVFNACITCAYIMVGTFGPLITFLGMTQGGSIAKSRDEKLTEHLDQGLVQYTFNFLTIFGSLLLRLREPSLPRPYRPTILFPIIFCLASLFLVLRGLIFAPVQGIALVLVVLLAVFSHLHKAGVLKR